MKVGGETVQTWMIGEKTVCGSQSHFAVGDNKNSAFPVPIPACRQERTLRGQPQEAEIPTFCLRAASKALPAPLIHSWAGSMASALVVEHPGASCLTKQAAVVIKKTLYSHANLGMAPIMALFTHKRAIPAMWAGWWGNPDQVHPKSHSALEAQARIAGPSTNTA